MRSLKLPFSMPWVCVLLSLWCVPGLFAAEHTVESRPDNTFFPRDLEIAAGDTVTWVNIGGRHNVAATDGSFRCANGCGVMSCVPV